jgi:hypothetical protein
MSVNRSSGRGAEPPGGRPAAARRAPRGAARSPLWSPAPAAARAPEARP